MSKLRVNAFTISLDGFGAGPDQTVDAPLGVAGETLHQWFVPTRTFQRMVLGKQEGRTGVDDEKFVRLGSWRMGCPPHSTGAILQDTRRMLNYLRDFEDP